MVQGNKYCGNEETSFWADRREISRNNEAGSRQRVSSAPKAKEIVGVGGWAHKHRHLVLIGDLDLKGKETYLKACPGALRLRHTLGFWGKLLGS